MEQLTYSCMPSVGLTPMSRTKLKVKAHRADVIAKPFWRETKRQKKSINSKVTMRLPGPTAGVHVLKKIRSEFALYRSSTYLVACG